MQSQSVESNTYVTARGKCPTDYTICRDLAELRFGRPETGVILALDPTALDTLATFTKDLSTTWTQARAGNNEHVTAPDHHNPQPHETSAHTQTTHLEITNGCTLRATVRSDDHDDIFCSFSSPHGEDTNILFDRAALKEFASFALDTLKVPIVAGATNPLTLVRHLGKQSPPLTDHSR